MIVLSAKQIILLHDELIRKTGGTPGLRDEGLLESALNAPFQSFQGKDIYPSAYVKAARLGFGLVKNHAFVDGNKRIAAHAMLTFLSANKLELDYTQPELEDVFLSLAAGTADAEDLLTWILEHRI